ncbi:MAG: hypothetical protein IKZ57_00570 [Spirochaetia bacterium]|nr:hypothetical protein [Spirochaetia bacterium]
MDKKFLKRIINDCSLNDFIEDENASKKHEVFDKYLEKFTSFLYSNENQLIEHFWSEYIALSEVATLQSSPLLRRYFIFLDCATAVYNYVAEKSKQKSGSELSEHISIQLQNDLRQFKGILLLAINGCLNSVITEYRTMYESFVIGQYLVLHPDLVSIYKEHSQFLRYHLTRLVGNSKPEWDKVYEDYIEKYGKEFTENYGWTKDVIQKKKDRIIGTLVKECELDTSLVTLYKYSCSYVHSSTFSVSTRPDLNSLKVFFQATMYFILQEILSYMQEIGLSEKEIIILDNILMILYEDFKNI